MKILYAVQATGNGHIARATELLPFLQKYGNVDIFLSGSNSTLNYNLPVQYTSKGLSLFYGNRGSLNYWKLIQHFAPLRILKEAKALPVEKYDIVINDFESITALACKMKKKSFVHFGHQASFVSDKTPRPFKKDIAGELILKNYASSKHNIGLHFDNYDGDIFSPIIKSDILQTNPSNKGHITVYLAHYSDAVVIEQLQKVPEIQFHLFSKKVKEKQRIKNVLLIPVNNQLFNESMINSAGVITGAGFETPAEALYLNKKIMCLPILGQYEQLCNAAALEKLNATIVHKIDEHFSFTIKMWLNSFTPAPLKLKQSTTEIIEKVIAKGTSLQQSKEELVYSIPELHIPTPEYSF